MRSMSPRPTTVLASVLLAVLLTAQAVQAGSSYTPRELALTVYADGVVAVDYAVEVDPTRARVNLTLFGVQYLDLIVEDQDGLPLDYSTTEDGLTVDTLGSTSVFLSYLTPDLTDKSARIWVLSVSTPVSSSILLPESSTIVGLNVVPLSLGSLDGSPLLTMPAGDVEVDYIIGVVGTREHAMALIKDAESTIFAAKDGGVNVSEAESLLQQAYASLGEEDYVKAEQLAGRAKISALNAEAAASSAKEAIDSASTSVSTQGEEGRATGLEEAERLLKQAEDAYEAGDYAGAETLAEQAQSAAAEAAKAPSTPYTWFLVGAGGVMLALVAAVFTLRRRRPVEGGLKVDLDAIFERNPHLRLDDREVIRFLAGSGGEAFATEIRERFGIPRTSAWRMIRRLQREGIVEVREIGGQSLVRIRSNYRAEGGAT